MKAQILKIAGVKTEAEFYKKFPSEEAFMKKHGKALKKAQVGASIEGTKTASAKPISFSDVYNQTEADITGISPEEKEKKRQEALAAAAASKQSTQQSSGMEGLLGTAMKGLSGSNGDIIGNLAGMFAHGGHLPMAQGGMNAGFFGDTTSTYGYDAMNADPFNAAVGGASGAGAIGGGGTPYDWSGKLKGAGNSLLSQAGTIAGQIGAIGAMQQQQKQQEQFAKISDVVAQAAESQDIDALRQKRYVRPEDMVIQQGQLGNPYGQGTNYLAAKNGAEIANTFAPNTIYTDLGYEPLHDTNVKQFQFGGIASGIGSWVTGGGFQDSPEGQIGATAGGIAGSFLPIPGGKQIGEAAGGLIGGFFGGGRQKQTNNYKKQGMENTMRAVGANYGNVLRSRNSGFMEEGGWVSHDWQPQVIATFGEHKLSDLLQPPHDADMLRAGGHLKEYTPPSARAMYTGRDLPYQMEDGGQMAMGGDLQVHRGQAETLSYNPFLPDGGETVMFRGPSHDNGGMPVSFGQNGVEVEGGEPAVKLQDGGSPEGNLVVYGNMMIPNYGVAEIGDPNAKGKKFKNYINDLSKIEARQNKIVEKNTNNVNDLNVLDTFDKFSLQSSQASIIGANMKLKDIAAKKLDTAAVQNAILDTAKEHGLVSDDLAKGKIKAAKANDPYAKFGGKLTKAQNGLNATKFYEQQQAQQNMINNWPGQPILNTIETPPIPLDYTQGYQAQQDQQNLAGGWPTGAATTRGVIDGLLDLIKAKGYDTTITSGTRPGAKTKQGKTSRHAAGEAVDVKFPVLGKSAYQAMVDDQDIARYALANNLTLIDEYNPAVAKKTGATGGHVHIGLDKGTPTADAFKKQAVATHPTLAPIVAGVPAPAGTPAVAGAPSKGFPQLAASDYRYLQDLYSKAQKAGKGPDVLKFQKEYNRLAPEYAKSVIGNDPLTAYGKKMGYDVKDLRSNEDSLFGQRTMDYMSAIKPAEVKPLAAKTIKGLGTPTLPTLTRPANLPAAGAPAAAPTRDYWGDAMNIAQSLTPLIRPTNQEPFDPSQLSGELFALSQNQLEPVPVQLFTPQLGTPYDISLQDKLNANQADFNAMQRQTGYNPEALAALAAQKYAANSQVLGEQFRLNQAEKAQVYGENRNLLNQAQLQNIGALDVQAQRQAQARSNTKQQAQVALNSISDKIAKNKLENRTLGVYENLYNYRFGPDGRAYNVNAPQQFNRYGAASTGKGTGAIPEGMSPTWESDESGNPVLSGYKKKKEDKTVARNGSIVKAIKNL